MADTEKTDVLICGAGPAGLLIALGLAQQGVDTMLIEKRERDIQASLGRASLLFPRSMELLEQVDVAEEMTQEGFVSSVSINWNSGQRVTDRNISILDGLGNTLHHYHLSIRQSNSEEIFHAKYSAKSGKKVLFGWALDQFVLDSSPSDGYNVTATLKDSKSGETRVVRSKYIVGADGGQSTVRQVAGIAMEGLETEYQWVRMDGKYKTNMPDSDIGVSTLETKTHGNVLWQKLNGDMHRIGFVITPALKDKFRDGATEEEVVREAKRALQPFTLEVERLDWFTAYSIRQKVAATLQHGQFVLLAGDAAHTHSSGFAQGMNTAVHDATNLVWKLAGVLKGWYRPEVLATYNAERRPAAQKLIEIDQMAAAAISGNIPPQYGGVGASVDEVLKRIWRDNVTFSTGLGIQYDGPLLHRQVRATNVHPGTRVPDVLLRRPGPKVPVRLFELTRASGLGLWTVLVFAGYPVVTKEKVGALREALAGEGGVLEKRGALLNLITISGSPAGSAWAALGGPAIGRFVFDPDGTAHDIYAISLEVGGIAVIRPDGIMGFATTLDGASELESYLDTFCL